MEIVGGLLSLLIPVAVISAIIVAVVALRRRPGLEPEAAGIGTVRRLYFYFGTFVYMMIASVGVVLVARYLLDELFGPPSLSRDATQLALGVALGLIWTPVWAWHRLRVYRLAQEEPAERRSVLRKLSVYLTLAVTAGLIAQSAIETLRWIFGARPFTGYPVAALTVWSSLWAITWVLEEREGQPTDDTRTVRRLYVYGAAAAGLVLLAAGLGNVLYVIFRQAYEGVVSLPVFLQGEEPLWGDFMKSTLAIALVGAGIWATHWLSFAREDKSSDIRQFYLYTLAIMGGVVTVLSSTGVLLFGLLQWGFGTPDEASAGAHFRFVPGALAPLLVGLLLWAYHWTTVREERAAAGQLSLAQRSYAYIMAALGLGALAGTVIVLVSTVIAIIVTSAREVLAGPDWWRDRMVFVATLGLLGIPVWGYYWYVAQRRVAEFGAEERNSLPRRILIFGTLTGGTLAFLGSISYLFFAVLNASLENNLSLTLLRDAKWSIATLAAALVFTPYYWFVLQEDRRAAPPAERVAARKAVTLLIGGDGRALIDRIEGVLGAKVRVLQRADPDVGLPELSAEDLQRLDQRIAEAAGGQVLVVVDQAGIQVYSYR